MRYVPLFTLRLRHPLYEDERCTAFRLEPTAEGQRVIERYRLVARPSPEGIAVYARVEDGGQPIVPFPPDMAIGLQLFLEQPAFLSLTSLDHMAGVAAPVFRNPATGKSGELTLERGDVPLARGAFAGVEVRGISGLWPAAAPPELTLTFQVKALTLAYYFVSDRDIGEGGPTIVDRTPVARARLAKFRTVPLTRSTPSRDAIAADLAARYPDHRRFLIVSEKPVPLLPEPARHLVLLVGGKPAIEPLEAPPATNRAMVTLTRAGAGRGKAVSWVTGRRLPKLAHEQLESLFQIIRY